MAKAPANKRPSLLTRIETSGDQINAIAAVVGEDAVISASEDKYEKRSPLLCDRTISFS